MFGVKQGLVADFRAVDDLTKAAELGFPNPFIAAHWDFVLAAK